MLRVVLPANNAPWCQQTSVGVAELEGWYQSNHGCPKSLALQLRQMKQLVGFTDRQKYSGGGLEKLIVVAGVTQLKEEILMSIKDNRCWRTPSRLFEEPAGFPSQYSARLRGSCCTGIHEGHKAVGRGGGDRCHRLALCNGNLANQKLEMCFVPCFCWGS